MIGWQSENFSRMGKRMKDLSEYLKPPVSPERRREEGRNRVLELFKRIAMKGHSDGGK